MTRNYEFEICGGLGKLALEPLFGKQLGVGVRPSVPRILLTNLEPFQRDPASAQTGLRTALDAKRFALPRLPYQHALGSPMRVP
jgi:hypothetical protein